MSDIISFISENRAWLFSGLLAAVVAGVFGLYKNTKTPSQKQTSGKDSTNIQAGQDVHIGGDIHRDEQTDTRKR
jgi:hypothetical protein